MMFATFSCIPASYIPSDPQSFALQDGSAYWLSSKTGVDFDPVGNCLKWIYDNNPEDYSEQRRDCCQINWERGRDGIETTYTRDASGKLISETSRGKVKTYERKGLTTITRRHEVGKTQSYLVSEEILDMAGNVIVNKVPTVGGNLLTTSYTYNIPERITTTTTPFGTTKQESFYADKQLASAKTTTNLTSVYTYTVSGNNQGSIVITRTENGVTQAEEKDLLENSVKKITGNAAVTTNSYSPAGLLVKKVLPDGETFLYKYQQDTRISGLDLDGDGELNPAIDKIDKAETVFDITWPGNKGSWKTVTSSAWHANWKEMFISWKTDDNTLLRNQMPGLTGYDTQEQPAEYQKGSSYTITRITPDGQRYENTYTLNNGNVVSAETKWKDSSGNIVTTSGMSYNTWGQVIGESKARTGTTSYTCDAITGDILSKTTPDGAITQYQYDYLGRSVVTVLPDGTKQYIAYDDENNIIRQWGSQQYPVSFEYDAYGRKTGIVTYRVPVENPAIWPEEASGDHTTWIYELSTGNLLQKKYADGKGITYTYTTGGKLKTLTNARGHESTYSYDLSGKMLSIKVNDNGITPTKTKSYDQFGRMISATTEGVVTYLYLYNDRNQIVEEHISIPAANGNLERNLVRSYDSYGRASGYQVKHGDVVEQNIVYSYSPMGQLKGVDVDGKEFTYSYLPQAPHLVSNVTCPVHTVTNTYETNRDTLISKENRWKNKVDTPVISRYTYVVNNLEQRISVSTDGEAFGSTPADRVWSYDALGQVVTSNEDYYTYDQIGNRKTSRIGTETEISYTANSLNLYDLIGNITLTYDSDGNQLTGFSLTTSHPDRNDLSFAYNAENRPISVKQNGEVKEIYSYDHMGRRIRKGDTFILYNGYNAVSEYTRDAHTLKMTYAWGCDLSGSIQGAGGVGGLLSITEYNRQLPLASFPCYDGNGNITEYLAEENTGTLATHYDYDVFGQVIRKTGEGLYSYQFSTKQFDETTWLNYYNYRVYDSVNGRWINRDPIGEKGGLNQVSFVRNNPVNKTDYLGLLLKEIKRGDVQYRDMRNLSDDELEDFTGSNRPGFTVAGMTLFNYPKPESVVECEECKIKVSDIPATMVVHYYRDGTDKKGRNLEKHEEGHVASYMSWWNDVIIELVNSNDGEEFKTEKECDQEKEKISRAYSGSIKMMEQEQVEYDRKSY